MKTTKQNLAVFINTCDGYEDCWGPFLMLFDKYGSDLARLPLFLNTERLDYVWPSFNLSANKVWAYDEPRPTWSECLYRGLDRITEVPYVLYLQEDYFLTKCVNVEWINKALAVMDAQPDVAVIYLNQYGPQFQKKADVQDDFVEVSKSANYLLSTQAAIWRKDILRSLICPWENAWMFEKFGSMRARKLNVRFLSVNQSVMQNMPIFDYIYTGIIKGQWKIDCIDLFKVEKIEVDFNHRGFYHDKGQLKSRIEVVSKLFSNPIAAWKSIKTII
jgi:hypothetical protein